MDYNTISKWRKILFGIAIINIMVFHFINQDPEYTGTLYKCIRYFIKFWGSFGVEIFLFLSAFGLCYSFSRKCSLKDFYSKRCTRLIIPFLVWAIPYYLIRDVFCLHQSFFTAFQDIFFISYIKSGFNIGLWYVFCSVCFYLLFPLLYKLVGNKSILSTILLLAVTVVLTIGCRFGFSTLYKNLELTILRLPVFVMGIYAGRMAIEKKSIDKRFIYLFIMMAVIVRIAYFLLLDNPLVNRYSATLLAMAFILALCQLNPGKLNKTIKASLEKVGEYTLELYMVHVSLINLFKPMGFPMNRLSNYVLMIGITIIISCFLHRLFLFIQARLSKETNNK